MKKKLETFGHQKELKAIAKMMTMLLIDTEFLWLHIVQ
jgi:hypothetical protein